MRRVAVIGAGAAGMMAAVMAARQGAAVTVYEKNDRVGKKILATGNGKCNFSNRDFCVEYYNGNGRAGTDYQKLKRIFRRFGVEEAVEFFETAGMLVADKNGYLYPWSKQAATVLDILRLEMERCGVCVRSLSAVEQVGRKGKEQMLYVQTAQDTEKYHSVIVACGGCAAAQTGSDGSGYQLAAHMGHGLVSVVPALVQLRCQEKLLRLAAGVRCEARLRLCAGDECIQEEIGELQFTDYGISGIPVFQLSRQAAYLLEEGKKPCVYIDLFPDMDEQTFSAMCMKRLENGREKTAEEFVLGLANKKLNQLMLKQADIRPYDEIKKIGSKRLRQLLYSYRKLCVHVSATNPFEQAQVTAGGVPLWEVTDGLESLKMPGVYYAGEILDVDGRCGGYNLQWAWTSGAVAGRNAALGDRK